MLAWFVNSVRATILKVEDRRVTIEMLSVEGVDIVGENARINGLRTTGGRSRPPKEDHVDTSHELVYQIADGENIGSLEINSFCIVSWE